MALYGAGRAEPWLFKFHFPGVREVPCRGSFGSPPAHPRYPRCPLPLAEFARNLVIGFARMAGATVGVLANQPAVLAGCLDIHASQKVS